MSVHNLATRKRKKELIRSLKVMEVSLKNIQMCLQILNKPDTKDSRLKYIANELNYIRSDYSNRMRSFREEIDRINDLIEKESIE